MTVCSGAPYSVPNLLWEKPRFNRRERIWPPEMFNSVG